MYRLKHRWIFALGIQVRGRRNSNRAHDGGAQIGEDIAKEVGTYHNIESIGIANKVSGKNVNVELIGGNVGKLGANLRETFVPKWHSKDNAIRLRR